MKKVLIIGAGVAGKSLAEDLRENGFQIAGFLDDHVKTTKKYRVLGGLKDVNRIAKSHSVSDIMIAIPSAPSSLIRDLINSITLKKVKISIIPRSFKIIARDTVSIKDLKAVDILSFIGRQPVKHNFLAARKHLQGKVALVTGAAGSIGSELTRQLLLLKPKKIICVDWWENGMFYLQQELNNKKTIEYIIANIQSQEKMEKIFSKHKPDIVFHAAAYKHVPLMQDNPLEAFNNNVHGSKNVMEMCIKHKAQEFVYVSTDKAVNPVNIMGTTKRIGEMLLEVFAARQKHTKMTAVRFGNVLASNGSVIPIFQKQISEGGPVTVTDAEVTRYFMTIEEASQLIIQSSTLGEHGEIFVLDMGEPIKIIDLARNMIKLSGKNIEIKFIGLRPGEKLHEELSFVPDTVKKTTDEKIYINKNEKEFNHSSFSKAIDSLLEKTLAYKLTDAELFAELKQLGFNLKDRK